MRFLRTPDEHFENLPDFPFAPHYVDIDEARMHYLDEGSSDEVLLCLHGEPSWSFLYRKMIPPLAKQYRVIAPDLFGFGRSDKPAEIEDHSIRFHLDTLIAFIEALDLTRITLVCQDWGGILGLPIASQLPERFARLVIMNTGLPSGAPIKSEGFLQWLAFARRTGRELRPGNLLKRSVVQPVSDAVMAAYDAPFPDASYRAGVAAMPLLIPTEMDSPGAEYIRAARERLKSWNKPAILIFSDSDPVTRGSDLSFLRMIPTTREQPHIIIEGAGHFLQEEKGEEIASHILKFMARTPL